MLKRRKIIRINFIVFFVGWVIVFLLGADFPPPIGFLWLVLLLLSLDIIQTYYLKKYFLMRIENENKMKLFFVNTLFYFLGGFILSTGTSLYHFQLTGASGTLIWTVVIIVVGVFYGIAFWLFNLLLFRLIK